MAPVVAGFAELDAEGAILKMKDRPSNHLVDRTRCGRSFDTAHRDEVATQTAPPSIHSDLVVRALRDFEGASQCR